VVVHIDDPTTAPAAIAARLAGTVGDAVGDDTFVIEVAPGREGSAARSARAAEGVGWAEADRRYRVEQEPNDPCYVSGCLGNDQWALRAVNAAGAWVTTQGSPSVVVGVLDTGVDTTHPDLAGKVTVGPNFAGGAPTDLFGHGTAVAGLVAAATNNSAGVASLGWNTRVLAVKVLDDQGNGSASDIAQGVRWATDNGASVINLSLAGPDDSFVLSDAVRYAREHNVLVVAAAGNSGSTTRAYPAADDGVLSVAATDRNDNLASWSNRGSWVDIAAPGANVLSTWPGGIYNTVNGTSFATPLVAAAAALVRAADPGMPADGVAVRLMSTADQLASLGTAVQSGRLNAARAIAGGTGGYWMVASDGGVFSFGSAAFHGSTGSLHLNQPIVGMTPTPSGNGYWMVASDGGIFAFGDARYYGSTGSLHLNQPIVGMAPTSDGTGYWMVASDGGVFSFGSAAFHGSTGSIHLNEPIVGIAPTPSGAGYWMVASDGGIFAFGDAHFYGSAGALRLNQPINGMSPTPDGGGYWMVASDGGIFAFGDAGFAGSAGSLHLNRPVVGMAAVPAS
jgi:ribosomal protein L24E